MLGFFKKLFGGGTDLRKIIADGAVIVDVRTPAEYRQGHVAGSKNIPLDTVQANISKIKQFNKPIVTCCASGMRSGSAAGMLKSAGIEAYNGGSWTSVDQLKK